MGGSCGEEGWCHQSGYPPPLTNQATPQDKQPTLLPKKPGAQESSLGVFIKFKEQGFGWASRLVHYMLSFKLDIKKKYEMWSRWSRTFEVFTVRV
ncbi:hypothetical protein Bca52824_080616 [Brassica carinata]|uniref:Uncharacterized protein n=1 Tax=Brassica carinata TaxID=52824 RepID=A0A8X7PFU3_BRACI|nr:hypothetical protein Bca52824_080616 [Brassica carinata]